MNLFKYILFSLAICVSALHVNAQVITPDLDLSATHEYEIGDITVTGATNLDHNAIILITELSRGQKIKIPGDAIAKAIKKLWDQKLFSDIKISATKVIGNTVYLDIYVVERPRLSGFSPHGMRKGEFEKMKESLDLYQDRIVTEDLIYSVKRITRNYFIDKGYLNVKTEVTKRNDPNKNNYVILDIKVKKGNKIKINDIILEGNYSLSDAKIYRTMKDTKRRMWWRFWKTSKFMESDYKKDKAAVVAKLNDKGLRDAKIEKDSVYKHDNSSINIYMKINEGKPYYYRSIKWIGNAKYSSGRLDSILGIKKGDLYNASDLESRLFMSPNNTDITSLYMDNGYLFFSINPVEVNVENDSIDFEMRINEGRQARVKNIIIRGNTKTNDRVIRREIRTKPGDLFSRNDIIRTQRELAQMQYFNPEKFGINPIPNPADGTVDIEYTVEERASDQVQLSGGWGGGRVIGTLGLVINNFSIQNLFKKPAWQPLPSGDGQQLSINAQSTGSYYQGYNLSFTEPWLGGKKPISLTVSAYHTFSSNDSKKRNDPEKSKLLITGTSVGLGKRLKWPDDYFTVYHELAFQYYELHQYRGVFSFSDGYVNNFSYRFNLSRNSIDQPIYPRSGANYTFSAKITPPYSLMNGRDYSDVSDQERYKWLEYAKLKFTTSHVVALSKDKKLVLNARTGFGLLMPWNKQVGNPPFERFVMGGSGLTGVNFFFGREIIALRGYEDNQVSSSFGDMFISKYTLELRYPVSLNPSATIWLQAFADAGKTWSRLKDYNPFDVYRSGGVGIRLFMPMFGLLGFDYGWRLDTVPGTVMPKGQFHFTIGMNLGEL